MLFALFFQFLKDFLKETIFLQSNLNLEWFELWFNVRIVCVEKKLSYCAFTRVRLYNTRQLSFRTRLKIQKKTWKKGGEIDWFKLWLIWFALNSRRAENGLLNHTSWSYLISFQFPSIQISISLSPKPVSIVLNFGKN